MNLIQIWYKLVFPQHSQSAAVNDHSPTITITVATRPLTVICIRSCKVYFSKHISLILTKAFLILHTYPYFSYLAKSIFHFLFSVFLRFRNITITVATRPLTVICIRSCKVCFSKHISLILTKAFLIFRIHISLIL